MVQGRGSQTRHPDYKTGWQSQLVGQEGKGRLRYLQKHLSCLVCCLLVLSQSCFTYFLDQFLLPKTSERVWRMFGLGIFMLSRDLLKGWWRVLMMVDGRKYSKTSFDADMYSRIIEACDNINFEFHHVSNPNCSALSLRPLQSSLCVGTKAIILFWITCKWCNSVWYLIPQRHTTALNHQFLGLRKCTRAHGAKHFPFPFFLTICSLLSYRILNFTASVSKQRLFYRLGCTFI